MGSNEHDSLLCNNKTSEKNNYESKFNTLRIISLKAINEFEDLQKKCEDNYAKYLEERENYLRTKKELDILKEVSGEALGEYENLHRKFTIEQECRDQAEEYAKQQVKANKQLKRQSAILLNTLVAKAVDFDLEELASQTDSDSSSSTEDHGICDKQIEGLKQQVESLQIKTDDLTQKLHLTEEKLNHEIQEHMKTKEALENNKVNFKQLNQVSLLALDDYSNLQQKYETEIQCRAQAEKLAVEKHRKYDDTTMKQGSTLPTMFISNPIAPLLRRYLTFPTFLANRDHEAVIKQSEFISKDLSGEERLQKALEEISNLTKKLHEQKTEFDNKVKELEDELASSNDVQKLKSLEKKINTFAQGMETLESRLTRAQQRASEEETKAKRLEDLLKKAQEPPDAPPPPPLPPPPPPPPAPAQLLRKFVGIISSGKRSLKKSKSSTKEKEDPRVQAMSEMMERIKNGKVELRRTIPRQASTPDDGSAMENLRDVLKSTKPSPSKDDNEMASEDGQKPHTFGVHLRKPAERKPRSLSASNGPECGFRSVLRKPRSHSTGDTLDDEGNTGQTMDQDLYKLLQKQKAAAERDEKAREQQNHSEVAKGHQADKTSEEKGKTL